MSGLLVGCLSATSKPLRGGRTQSLIGVPDCVSWGEKQQSELDIVVLSLLCAQSLGVGMGAGVVCGLSYRSRVLLTRQEGHG